MLLSYLVQLIVFLISVILLSIEFEFDDSIMIIEPYFECIEMSIILFLFHFQFHAFYYDSYRILDIISRKLHYINITSAMVFAGIYLSILVLDSFIINVFQVISGFLLFFMVSFVYYQMLDTLKTSPYRD